MNYTVKILPVFIQHGNAYAPVEVTDERGNRLTCYRGLDGGLTHQGRPITDPDMLRAFQVAVRAEYKGGH